MIGVPLDKIDKKVIEALVINKVSERRTLEYKQELPSQSDEAKREFLSDVASFANSGGGDILYGIADERDTNGQPTGRPSAVEGVEGINETADQLRLENLIRDGVAPRISGIQTKCICGMGKGAVMLVRIPRSWAAPHMVVFKNLSRFFARNSAGKYQMDVGEVRSAFVLSESLPDKLRALRTHRLALIASGETPVEFSRNRAAVLHLIPVSAIENRSQVDVSKEAEKHLNSLKPILSTAVQGRFNADGFLAYDNKKWGEEGRVASTYVQVFRSGTIEIADQRMLIRQLSEYDEFIPMAALEGSFIDAASRCSAVQKELGLSLPIVVMLSLLGVKGVALTVSATGWTNNRIDRDILIAPDVLLDDFETDFGRLLRPVFDFIWQSAGVLESPNYLSDGRWGDKHDE
jgi:hypothetical protein